MKSALWSLGLAGTQAAYRAGQATPTEVLEAVLARMAEVEPVLNAFACIDEAGARAAAGASTERWRRGTPAGALDGAVLSIKDNITVAGLPCAWGSELFRDFVPPADELPVARLRAQGHSISTSSPHWLRVATGRPWR